MRTVQKEDMRAAIHANNTEPSAWVGDMVHALMAKFLLLLWVQSSANIMPGDV
jgi:hypothetical protein